MPTIVEDNLGNKITCKWYDYNTVKAATKLMFQNGALFVAISRFGFSMIVFP